MLQKKRLACLLALALVLFAVPLASAQQAGAGYEAVFDTSDDAGLLTARFLKLVSTSKEKSGDSTILTSPDGMVMLIDAGEVSCGGQVVEALKAMGVTRIDFLVSSHPHIDHIGGFQEVLRNFEVGAVYKSAVEYPTNTYTSAMAEIENLGIEVVILSEGDSFLFGDSVQVEVFHPAETIDYYQGYPNNSTQFINDLSLVLKLTYGESTMLFAGDLYSHGEKEVVTKYGDRLQADAVKINHHGDDTSSIKTWRGAVQPKYGVMMHDGIASLQVIQKYRKEGTDIYVTFLDGCVKISTPGDATYSVLSEFDHKTEF